MRTKLTAVMTIALALSACSATATISSNAAALARGDAVKTLAAGKLDALPTGPIYVRMIRFASPPGYVIQSKQHVASFVYVETGLHRLTLAGQLPIDLVGGQATFHQSLAHTHLNPGSGTSVWFSIAVWPSSARSQPLADKVATRAFESHDFDRAALPQGAYSEVLRQITLSKDGTAGAHQFGGLSAFFVLAGTVTIRSAHQPSVTLGVGQGVAFLPGVALQEMNAGSDQAVYLEHLSTPVGRDFDVPLRQPPPA